ncbi:MAG TPA: TonB-dependent receptor [Bryobacteraceae bacterium]|nr:TonB-dependent receptor [Bryobacteraceae bacterium]
MRTPLTKLGFYTGAALHFYTGAALHFYTGAALLMAPWAFAGSPPALSGGIYGQVKSATGITQMGATVLLFDRYDQLIRRALTNEQGKFAFGQLSPESYSIRVTLASFVPAIRRNISVAAGSENLLQINMATLFSTVDLVASGQSRGTLMTDDWKWVLRESQSTRPVLRILPTSSSAQARSMGSIFSNTTGLVKLSAGDGDSFTSGSDQDLGTAFAFATSLYGTSRVQFSGNIGYIGTSAIPAAGLRTSYSRTQDGTGPQVTLTVRQLYLGDRGPVPGTDSSLALRTASLAMRDSLDLSDNLRLEYGLSLESVSILQRINWVSPFARVTYDLGSNGAVRFGYSDGSQPFDLAGRASVNPELGESLNQDLAALAQLPRISRTNGQLGVQRTQNFEMGYSRREGSRTYSASVYHESAENAAFTLSGQQGFVSNADSLPDLGSNSRIFDVGNYGRIGFGGSVKQALGEHAEASVSAGRTGTFLADSREAISNSASDLRSLLRMEQRPWVTLSLAETLPVTGTHVLSSYGWADSRTMMPDHYFLTEDINQVTGWNVRIRQPLPMFFGLGGRLEATAELRNMLAQGYLPLDAAGRRALLTNSPRSVRGGLSFIF